mmetsp:Transcript_2730/g.4863  ORF Transcript_2730/g.4863 Transcript_2730/m.4863 type:complete len:225 (-) Transcript_2730:334-1008(-)
MAAWTRPPSCESLRACTSCSARQELKDSPFASCTLVSRAYLCARVFQAAPQLGRRFDPESPLAPARRTDKASSVTRRTSSSGRHTKAASEDIVKDLITTDGDALVGCSVLLHGLTAQSDLNGKVSRWSTTILFSQPEEYVALMAALYSTGGDSDGARSRSRALSSATHWRRPGQGAAALRQPAGLNHGCRFENTRARQGSGQGGCDRRRAATPFASTTGSRNHS